MYERVVGRLPSTRKIALTSNLPATAKNGSGKNDTLIECEVSSVVGYILQKARQAAELHVAIDAKEWKPYSGSKPTSESDGTRTGEILDAIGAAIRQDRHAIIVDDSQMFGGLIAQYYDRVVTTQRVFGDHSGFVGAGIGIATGLAHAHPNSQVWCLCGDQGFRNGLQALIFAAEECSNLTIVVLNNSGSASLIKQLRSESYWSEYVEHHVLCNASLSPAAIAHSLGCSADRIDYTEFLNDASDSLRAALGISRTQRSGRSPHVVEIVAPNEPTMWERVWRTSGFELHEPSL